MKEEIKFGTDGWRGVIGFDFVEEKVKIISQWDKPVPECEK